MTRWIWICVTIIVFSAIVWLDAQTPVQVEDLRPVKRADIMARAKSSAEHTWTCREVNTRTSCPQNQTYSCRFSAGQRVSGIAYDWGGMDAPETFDRKLAEGQAAGSFSRHGVTNCTTGMDCSGFVSYCWNQPRKYGTSTIAAIAAKPKYNWFTDMKPGDTLNDAGSHIVLFAEYAPNGNPIVYEARGSRSRVVRNERSWASLQGYIPLQYRRIEEVD